MYLIEKIYTLNRQENEFNIASYKI